MKQRENERKRGVLGLLGLAYALGTDMSTALARASARARAMDVLAVCARTTPTPTVCGREAMPGAAVKYPIPFYQTPWVQDLDFDPHFHL